MKKQILFAAFAALAFTGCIGDLDQAPLSDTAIPNGEIYSNEVYRKGQLAKIYGGFTFVGQAGAGTADIAGIDAGTSEYLRAFWSIQTLTTDEGHCIWSDAWVKEVCTNTWTSTKNDAIYAAYTRAIMMIAYANEFLRNTDNADAEVATERDEVRFLRAYAYWTLLDCFGNPPFVTEKDGVGAFKPEQTDSKTLFAWIKGELDELTGADSHLKEPHTQVYPRVDKGAAFGLLARLCLNHKTYLGQESTDYYTAAMNAAKAVIDAYGLADNYEALFMGDNGENPDALKELVFVSAYDSSKTQSYGGATYLIAGSQGNLKDGDKLRLGTKEAWAGLVTSSEFVTKLIGETAVDAATEGEEPTYTSIDKRALVSLRFSDDKEMDASNFAAGWHVWKFNNNLSTDPHPDNSPKETFVSIDFPMIRVAEMYLAYAESKARIDGGTTSDATAVGYIAALQQRAGRTPVSGSVSLGNIFDEITRELYWEGHRRTTLIRFDKFTSGSYLWPFKGGVASGQAISEHLKLFPIPSDDLQVNDNLVQNPGY